MARLRQAAPPTGHTILVVDDDHDLRQTTVHLLESNGHRVLSAENGPQAIELCRTQDIHLILLDYFMPGMTGEDVVQEVRTFDTRVQIVLQTGYASERPARNMLRDLEIQGYHDKSEGPDKLLVWVDAALKTFRHVRALNASRDGLSYILKATPELHRLQPLDDLLRGILLQLQGILGFSSACLATMIEPRRTQQDAFVATPEDHDFRIRVATGRFEMQDWKDLSADERRAVYDAAQSGLTRLTPFTALPLKLGERTVGVVLVDLTFTPEADIALLEIFATQAAMAIENVRLFELATIDDLTSLMNKRSWLVRVEDALHLGARHHHPNSILILDVDHFKRVNDTHGHLAGDQLLRLLGQILRAHLRASDSAGRYGGEELVALLPHTDAHGALVIAERLRQAIAELRLTWQGADIQVTASIGVATAPAGQRVTDQSVTDLIARADQALYTAKNSGRNRVITADVTPA